MKNCGQFAEVVAHVEEADISRVRVVSSPAA
eukprot:CAMPEP_0115717878 /NCGR_PEP_ID=MMETSP0272-20121206/77110_1 /TAXON_ID=71861 /ORGANISM="Scrippsiella trochoidea, Strain CCMP3099" /LENGTH=30 /DNA_ID= /DNA_START= /DNA_END= /DNA_ORIENTATION=